MLFTKSYQRNDIRKGEVGGIYNAYVKIRIVCKILVRKLAVKTERSYAFVHVLLSGIICVITLALLSKIF
jgi:hypothetical protein